MLASLARKHGNRQFVGSLTTQLVTALLIRFTPQLHDRRVLSYVVYRGTILTRIAATVGFDCSVTGALPNATAIAPPNDPINCLPSNPTCVPQAGAKRPLYAYNQPTNVVWGGNNDRPGYHSTWSFNNGAQNDICKS